MAHLGVQLYTLRAVDGPLYERLSTISRLGYDGIEFAGVGASDADTAAALTDTGLDAVGMHVGISDLTDSYASVVNTAAALDCDRLVVPSYDPEAFRSADGVDAAAERLESVADRLATDEIELHYHNHGFEFGDLGDETALDRLLAAVDSLRLEVDIGLAHHAGRDPITLIERHSDRVDLVHVTDSVPGNDDRRHADLGTGSVDLEGCVGAAVDAGVEWLLFEHGQTADPIRSLETAKGVLDDLLTD